MRLSTAITLALITLLAVCTMGAVATAPSTPDSSVPETVSTASEQPSLPASTSSSQLEEAEPKQIIRISLLRTGDARWSIESRYLLTDDDDHASFQRYVDRVSESDEGGPYNAELFEAAVSDAQEATGREMTLTDAGWDDAQTVDHNESIEHPDLESDVDVGVISYSFTWENFTRVDGTRLHSGDAFGTSDGESWLPRLAENQRLVIEPPNNYGFDDIPRGTRADRALVWDGPYEFDDGELEVVLLAGQGGNGGENGNGNGNGNGNENGNGNGNGDENGNQTTGNGTATLSDTLPTILGGLGLIALLTAVGAGGYLLAKRRDETDGEGATPARTAADSSHDTATERSVPADTDPVVTGPSPDPADDGDVDVELLSDEERVHRLLRQNNGRMKQATIVKETGWSNAKVSQLLSKMDEDEEIDKLRIGRENLITLPEVDPTEIE